MRTAVKNPMNQRLRADLLRVGNALGVVQEDRLDVLLGRFAPFLSHFAEIGAQLHTPSLSLLSFGNTPAFRQAVEIQLREDGHCATEIERIGALQAAMDPWMVARLAAMGGDPGVLGLYFRRRMTISEATHRLRDQGVAPEGGAALMRIAGLLQTGDVRIFCAELHAEKPPIFKVYFAPGLSNESMLGEKLLALAIDLGIAASHQDLLSAWCQTDAGPRFSSALVSLFFSHGGLLPRLKIDCFHVEIAAVEALLNAAHMLEALPAQPADFQAALQISHAEHMGVCFSQDERPGLTLYAPLGALGTSG